MGIVSVVVVVAVAVIVAAVVLVPHVYCLLSRSRHVTKLSLSDTMQAAAENIETSVHDVAEAAADFVAEMNGDDAPSGPSSAPTTDAPTLDDRKAKMEQLRKRMASLFTLRSSRTS